MDYNNVAHSARVREWQYLSGAEIASADRENTVVLVTCSPIEVHGTHLPTVADIQEGEGLSLRAIEIMCEKNERLEVLHLPPVYVATDVLPQTGSIMFRARTVERVFRDLGCSLAAQGFKHIWISNFHGGPRHFLALEKAAAFCNKRYGTRMISIFSLLIANFTDGGYDLSEVLGGIEKLNADTLEGDTHAGLVETSLMLVLSGDHVNPNYRNLPRRTIKFSGTDEAAIKGGGSPMERLRGFIHIMKYFETETWCGNPAGASKEVGETLLEVISSRMADALLDVYEGRLAPRDCHSPFWRYRMLLVNDFLARLFERFIGYRNEVW